MLFRSGRLSWFPESCTNAFSMAAFFLGNFSYLLPVTSLIRLWFPETVLFVLFCEGTAEDDCLESNVSFDDCSVLFFAGFGLGDTGDTLGLGLEIQETRWG